MTKTLYAFHTLDKTHETELSQCARQEVVISKLVHLRRAEKERLKDIQESEKQINKLKEIMESPLETEDQENLDAELAS